MTEDLGRFRPEPWTARSFCATRLELSLDVFFPEELPDEAALTRLAKDTCAQCPVSDDCLDFALRTRTYHGIFGGLTAAERSRLRARQLRQLRQRLAAGKESSC